MRIEDKKQKIADRRKINSEEMNDKKSTLKRNEIHIRDPFVFVENGKYYLMGTTGEDPWGKGGDLTLYESEDLEKFNRVCIMVTDGSLNCYSNIWAPELHKYNGKYYLIVSAFRKDIGRGSFIFKSERLDTGFQMLTGKYVTPKHWECLDATLFVYRGEPYLCFSNEWLAPVRGNGDGSLFIAKLSRDLKELAEEPKMIVSGKACPLAVEIGDKIKGYVAEGPYLYEENGKIVLLWSTFTERGYSVLKSVSETGVYGEYVLKETVFDKDGGHCMSFIDLNGERKIAFHQPNVTPEERMQIYPELRQNKRGYQGDTCIQRR